jgi:hypothetical protein
MSGTVGVLSACACVCERGGEPSVPFLPPPHRGRGGGGRGIHLFLKVALPQTLAVTNHEVQETETVKV